MSSERPTEDLCHAQLRGAMVWSLSAALSLWYRGKRPTLTRQQAEESAKHGRMFLRCYSKLSEKALQSGRLLYKVRPKCHYFDHLLDEVERLHRNPMSLSNFVDEDNMKVLKGVSAACHPRTVLVSWPKRYLLKKAMTWLKLKQRE